MGDIIAENNKTAIRAAAVWDAQGVEHANLCRDTLFLGQCCDVGPGKNHSAPTLGMDLRNPSSSLDQPMRAFQGLPSTSTR